MCKQLVIILSFFTFFTSFTMEIVESKKDNRLYTGKNVLDPINMATLTHKDKFKDQQKQIGGMILHNRKINDYILGNINLKSTTLKSRGYHGYPLSVSWSPDNSKIAAPYYARIKIWNVQTKQFICDLSGHPSYIYSANWSPDGTKLATTAQDQTIKIWNTNTWQCINTLQGHNGGVTSAAWKPDGTQLATGSADHSVKIWDTNTWQCIQTLQGHSQAVNSVIWNKDGTQLATGAKIVKIWDTTTWQCIQNLNGNNTFIKSISWNHDSTQLATGSDEFNIKIWNISTGECINTLKGHNGSVRSVMWSKDGTKLATTSFDCTKIWNLLTQQCTLILNSTYNVTEASWNLDGSKLAVSTEDTTIKIWDFEPLLLIEKLLNNNITLKQALLLLAIDKSMALDEKYELDAESLKIFESLPKAIQNTLKKHVINKHSWFFVLRNIPKTIM